MGGKASPDPEMEEPDDEFVELDPSGRYGRYREILGKGSCKIVYRGFDELQGIEIAWNQVKISDLLHKPEEIERLYSEVHLLKTLNHPNIIKFYTSWVDTKIGNINFITEIFTSGNLRQYRMKHKHVDLRAVKNWSKQILRGLRYLHSHDPPIIHRDLKCDNIFVNGNHGEVKIGDLGLATIFRHSQSVRSVIGTPEFMAPELYDEDYNELVDVYAFGMCLLELVTMEYPYMECTNAVQIYKKVISGVKPASLNKVEDGEVRRFIEKCIANVPDRLPAFSLLQDPFLLSDDDENHDDRGASPSEIKSSQAKDESQDQGNSGDFMIEGHKKDLNTILIKLRITDSTGHLRNIQFPFDTEADTSMSVANEMVAELDLTHQDVMTIAAMIDAEIQSYGSDWLEDSPVNSPVKPPEVERFSAKLTLERLPSGRIFWSNSPPGFPKNHHGHDDDNDDDGYDVDVIDEGVEENGKEEEDDVKEVMRRLEELLIDQEREMEEMKRRHRRAVADVLEGIPLELRSVTLGLHGLNLRDENSENE